MIIKETTPNVDQKNLLKLVINNQYILEDVQVELCDNNLEVKGHYRINLKFIKETNLSSSTLSLWVRPFNKLQFSGKYSLLSQLYNQISQISQIPVQFESIGNENNHLLLGEELNYLCKNERFKKTNVNCDYCCL